MIGSAILLGIVSMLLLPLEMSAAILIALTLWLTFRGGVLFCIFLGWVLGVFLGMVRAETHLWTVLSLIPVGIWFFINWRHKIASDITFVTCAFREPLVRRKLLRYGGLIFPCIIYPFGGSGVMNKYLMIATVFSFALEKISCHVPFLSKWLTVISPEPYERKEKSISGTTCYLLGAFVASLFPDPASVQALVMATIGDAWAVLVGQRWGKIPWLEGKTLEGSLACFCGALSGGYVFGLLVPMGQAPWLILLWGSLATLFTEGLFKHELDNLLTAPVSAAVMTAVIWVAYIL